MLGQWESMRYEVRRATDLTPEEQAALETLTHAVFPPETSATWPGRAIEWAPAQYKVVGWNAEGLALCHVGVVVREGRWNGRVVRIGGIAGVKTHPAYRRRGFADYAIQRALDFLHQQEDVDFGLLVCEPALVPWYEHLGWQRFPGTLLVRQQQATVPFTFNLPMTIAIRLREPLSGTIDLLGPPW